MRGILGTFSIAIIAATSLLTGGCESASLEPSSDEALQSQADAAIPDTSADADEISEPGTSDTVDDGNANDESFTRSERIDQRRDAMDAATDSNNDDDDEETGDRQRGERNPVDTSTQDDATNDGQTRPTRNRN